MSSFLAPSSDKSDYLRYHQLTDPTSGCMRRIGRTTRRWMVEERGMRPPFPMIIGGGWVPAVGGTWSFPTHSHCITPALTAVVGMGSASCLFYGGWVSTLGVMFVGALCLAESMPWSISIIWAILSNCMPTRVCRLNPWRAMFMGSALLSMV